MSLLNTKPRYFPTAIASESGWINPVTKEVLVSFGGLKSKLEAEAKQDAPAVEVKEKIVKSIKEVIAMKEEEVTKVKTPKQKPRVIGEVTETKVPQGQQLIGEVVEYNLETPVIGE